MPVPSHEILRPQVPRT